MSLAALLPLLRGNSRYVDLLAEVGRALREPTSGSARVGALPDAAKPLLLAALQDDLAGQDAPHRIFVIAARPERAQAIYEGLLAYVPDLARLSYFPTPDPMPYERVGWDRTLVSQRLTTLEAMAAPPTGGLPLMVVGAARAFMQPTMPPADFREATITLTAGEHFDSQRILAQLVAIGYQPASVVEEAGQFSRRGGIVDIYPATAGQPVRVDLFGDEIESLRLFDPVTQRSAGVVTSVKISPAMEVPLWRRADALPALRELQIDDLREEVRDEWRTLLNLFEQGESFEGVELFMPYFSPPGQPQGALDYLEPGDLIVIDDVAATRLSAAEMGGQATEYRQQLANQHELPANLREPFIPIDRLIARLQDFALVQIGPSVVTDSEGNLIPLVSSTLGEGQVDATDEEGLTEQVIAANPYAGNISRLVADLHRFRAEATRVVIVSQQTARLRELLEEQDIYPAVRKGGAKRAPGQQSTVPEDLLGPPAAGSLQMLTGNIPGGFFLREPALVVLSDSEIFGWRPPVRRASRRSAGEKEARTRNAFLSELKVGQYVVHIEHGVGRFSGLTMMATGEGEREYMVLEYAAGDRLYVPAEQTDRVLPYSNIGGAEPQLNKLGTAEWGRTKRKVRAATEELARELLKLYAARELSSRPSYGPDTNWQDEMEAGFPYTETEDQMRAIIETKSDMVEEKPMDRLICGDVGYGKTEVAMRAAFKAVTGGRQVAVLVPTTLLAQQHFDNFRNRMGAFPVNIEMVSRYRSKKEQKEIVEATRDGKVDILIGTHRLLQKDISFKNLGMIIIDEEQRFGVKHKERLKQMRTEVDVLTLTATPIPRTLHMAMIGVRDMSVIETPPVDRLPIKTYVTAYSGTLVREVILRELQRGGQVFFVHNRVQSIGHTLNKLQALVPEARFGIGHGQMEEHELERVMNAFVGREIDVLLATTIIESGLDIPNANTLIVDEAENFGLAQLYQLRGRVGRGATRAYAYFLYHKGQHLNPDAQERLHAIQGATELGAGFRIAMRDLEIRGAGNLLGQEQSGHITEVGFDLYTRLLAHAVEQARQQMRSASGGGLKVEGGNADLGEMQAQSEMAAEAELDDQPLIIDLPIQAYLPEDYVPDAALRLKLYQRLARPLSPLQSHEVSQELEDRFGPLPAPAKSLLYIVQVKGLALRAGVDAILTSENEITIRLSERAAAGGRLAKLPYSRVARRFPDLKVGARLVRLSRRTLGSKWQDALRAVLEELTLDEANQSVGGRQELGKA